jgi:hypothetical protein
MQHPQLSVAACQAGAIRPGIGLLGLQNLRLGRQRTVGSQRHRRLQGLLSFREFPLPPLRALQIQQQLAAPMLGMPPLGQR